MLRSLVVATIPLLGLATYGVDVSQRTYSSSFECMVSNGYIFTIVRVYQSSGHTDPNGPSTINDAWAGGMSYVDGYIFPCYSCGNPAQQMDDTLTALANGGVTFRSREDTLRAKANNETLTSTYGMIWIDVEGTQYWSSSTSNNVNFIDEMVNEGVKKGVSIGIYTSQSQWTPITGGTTKFSSYPLWYAHYDNDPYFDDFVPFGGWSTPAIKQYAGTTSLCSASVDKNHY